MNHNINYHWPLVGNKHITDWLGRVIRQDQVGGTYILAGPDNLGKTTMAKALARILLCESTSPAKPCGQCPSCRRFQSASGPGADSVAHADFHLVKKEKDKKNIAIAQIRALIETLCLTSFLNSYKIGVIKHAHTLSEEAANALLKTLEEPRPRVVLLLITRDIDQLPATIVSRAQVLKFRPVPTETIYDYLVKDHQVPRGQAKSLARLALGRPALALKFWQDREFKEGYQAGLQAMLDFNRQDLNRRFGRVQELVEGANNQEKGRQARRLLEVWQGVLRDLLLAEYGHFNLIQHEDEQERLRSLQPLYPAARIHGLLDKINQAQGMIDDNVNPVLAVESVVVGI